MLGCAVAAAFAVNVARHAFLGDDGYIAFRFAKNLVDGHGLGFNPGERVEGYTQPLWIALLAAGMKLGPAPEALSCILGVLCGAAIHWLLAWFSHRSAPDAGLDLARAAMPRPQPDVLRLVHLRPREPGIRAARARGRRRVGCRGRRRCCSCSRR